MAKSQVKTSVSTKRPQSGQTELSQEFTLFIKQHGKEEEFLKEINDIENCERATKEFLCTILAESKLNDDANSLNKKKRKKSESTPGAAGSGKGGGTNNNDSEGDDRKLTPVEVVKKIQEEVSKEMLNCMIILSYDVYKSVGVLKQQNDDISEVIKKLEKRTRPMCARFEIEMENTKMENTVCFNIDFDVDQKALTSKVLTSKVDGVLLRIGARGCEKKKVEVSLSEKKDALVKTSSELPYIEGLVRIESIHTPHFVEDPSKNTVWVVAGESGSGKTTYGMQMFPGAHMLRHSLIESDLINTPLPKEESSSDTLRMFLELVTTHLFNDGRYVDTDIYSAVRNVANSVNKKRNNWALELAKKLLKSAANDLECDSVKNWYNRKYGGKDVTLEKLVLVFDECGRSPEFTVGIIAKARDLLTDLKSNGLAKELALVLCGTGLEAVKTGTTGNKYIGSDPALTTVTIMLNTNLDHLTDGVGVDKRNAIKEGVFSRIAATNVRMLANGVLPVLRNELVTKHADDNTWGENASRLKAFCSFRFAMDFSVRAYVNLSGLAGKNTSARGKLLDKAFHYMLKSALRLIGRPSAAATSQIEAMDAKYKGDDEDIFRIGLATRDLSKTSNALRYLACKGKTAPLFASNGTAFENVVAVHLHRYSESLGISTGLKELQSAWPPAAIKNVDLDKAKVDELVKDMLEDGKADVQMIVEFFREAIPEAKGGPVALVLRQGVPNAQGADVMKFEAKNDEKSGAKRTILEVSTYQTKNWNSTRYRKDMSNAAKSLGVDADNTNCKPVQGSAGYSYQATLALCEKVAKEATDLFMNSEIVNRVIVFAYEASQRSKGDEELVKGCNVQLWSKEMLEPTISALVVAPDEDEHEKRRVDHP